MQIAILHEKECNDVKIDIAQKVIKETLWAIFFVR